jgi:hypothetical protein
MERGDAWHWTLRLKTDPERLIGSINLRKGEDTNRGFWLALTWHRQGLMTEACEAVTDFWFNTLKFPVLRVTKAVPNVGSSRISEKSGMRIVAMEERDYVSGRLIDCISVGVDRMQRNFEPMWKLVEACCVSLIAVLTPERWRRKRAALWKEEWDMKARLWIGLQMPGADMTQPNSWKGIFTDILCNE